LRQAFVMAEDRRFYTHHGIDWRARLHALWQNVSAFRAVRGASTISEQTVRMLHPRPRTLWSRWLEGWEAQGLERRFSKEQILEFYLNQVPYSGRRRGVAQAARAWFDRDLSTLSPPEILALAVMARAPARLDPKKGGDDLRRRVATLAARLASAGLLSGLDPTALAATPQECSRSRWSGWLTAVSWRRPAPARGAGSGRCSAARTALRRGSPVLPAACRGRRQSTLW
jgi:penicillin-binding protein 1C